MSLRLNTSVATGLDALRGQRRETTPGTWRAAGPTEGSWSLCPTRMHPERSWMLPVSRHTRDGGRKALCTPQNTQGTRGRLCPRGASDGSRGAGRWGPHPLQAEASFLGAIRHRQHLLMGGSSDVPPGCRRHYRAGGSPQVHINFSSILKAS